MRNKDKAVQFGVKRLTCKSRVGDKGNAETPILDTGRVRAHNSGVAVHATPVWLCEMSEVRSSATPEELECATPGQSQNK